MVTLTCQSGQLIDQCIDDFRRMQDLAKAALGVPASKFRRLKWSLEPRAKEQRSGGDASLASPPAYSSTSALSHADTAKDADTSHLVMKKLWDLALGPLKQVPMNIFIMYMAGNSISIFPIMMVGMLIVRPVKALFSLQATFKMAEGSRAVGQKLVYLLGNLVNIGFALYKCQSMGLLPTHSSDWLAFVEPQQRLEFSGGGVQLLSNV